MRCCQFLLQSVKLAFGDIVILLSCQQQTILMNTSCNLIQSVPVHLLIELICRLRTCNVHALCKCPVCKKAPFARKCDQRIYCACPAPCKAMAYHKAQHWRQNMCHNLISVVCRVIGNDSRDSRFERSRTHCKVSAPGYADHRTILKTIIIHDTFHRFFPVINEFQAILQGSALSVPFK